MKTYNLLDFKGGWFIGNFSQVILPSKNVEVSIKKYHVGDSDAKHFHKKADEITVIVSGRVKMNNIEYGENDIILIEKNDSTDFLAITDVITCVVKLPSIIGDKYLI
jgi:anti-sigma factor ChrR (cupin superfamily)